MARRWTLVFSSILTVLAMLAAGSIGPRALGQESPASQPADTKPAADDAKKAEDVKQADGDKSDDTAKSDAAKKPPDDDYELYQILADTIDQVERNYVKDVNRRELIEAAIHGVLSKLDPYSNYISPDEISRFRTSVESEFGGIGIQIGVEDGQLKVLSPLVGTPAYRAGLVAGDAILEIDGKSTEGIIATRPCGGSRASQARRSR